MNLVAKEALLMDVAGTVAQTFAVAYVRGVVSYHCHVRARGVAVFISCEIFTPSGELIARSEPRSFSAILLPHSASGEAKLFRDAARRAHAVRGGAASRQDGSVTPR
ncbi:MAG: hypothetical protein U0270_16785 [Labilithrix sp.]